MSQNILETIQKEFNGINSGKTSKVDYAKDAAEAFKREMKRKKAIEASRVTMQEGVIDSAELMREVSGDVINSLRPEAGEIRTNQQTTIEDNQR